MNSAVSERRACKPDEQLISHGGPVYLLSFGQTSSLDDDDGLCGIGCLQKRPINVELNSDGLAFDGSEVTLAYRPRCWLHAYSFSGRTENHEASISTGSERCRLRRTYWCSCFCFW